jgi:sulfide:quinone oxidoreductase
VGVNWRKPDDIKVPLAPVFKKKKITFIQQKGLKVNRFGNGMAYLPVL